jgi:CRISPR-associated endonuclease/helicase Cas3
MSDPGRYLRYWAKTSREDPRLYHPVLYHCLDVAAAGRTLLERRPRSLGRLAAVSGLTPETVIDLVTLLLSFHDLGKLADGFQGLNPELMTRLQGGARSARYDAGHWKHDTVGYVALEDRLRRDGLAGLLPPEAGKTDCRRFATTWLAAAMGHHGVPPALDSSKHRAGMPRQFPPPVAGDLDGAVAELRARFFPRHLTVSDPGWGDGLAASSWLFAGLAVAADWIGSNDRWFPFFAGPEPLGIDDYFERASRAAERAVEEAGLVERQPAARTRFRELWPDFEPTELQRLADEMPLARGPQLVVVEEVTGGGKTEAAFSLAHRLVAARQADGLYLGLPTMATANAMYGRLEHAYRRLFAAGSEPSLVLAHSRRHLYLALQAAAPAEPAADDDTAGAQCADWLADSRKKALLAEVGVGTVDQGLLGVLPARHQSLRLWGLAGKVLVVDEVHAADAYMQELLAVLLEAHAAFGGSAVLLSATLPSRQRQTLCRAFARGLGVDLPAVEDRSYPALLHLSREGAGVYPLAARPQASREVAVRLLEDETAVEETLAETIAAGGCACWIRNTVADAVAAWERWKGRLGGERALLFHARFTADDRETVERDVLRRFGPRSGPAERSGRLVVATQVVEQSLDLDFDTLVSDLAPIDLLIQRAGRLRRHLRDARGARIEDAADGRGEPVLHLHGPPPLDGAGGDWFAAAFPGAALVYPDHGALWLGARWLAERGRLRVPEDLRGVVEHVYSGEAEDRIPAALLDRTLEAEGQRRADASIGKVNAVTFAEGYRPTGGLGNWRDDVATPTRLGEPTSIVRLARRVGDELLPWHEDGAYPWDRSQVSVRRSQVAAEWPGDEALIEKARAEMPDKGRWAVVVVMHESGGVWSGRALAGGDRTAFLTYDAGRGLEIVKE